jgi:hypothetical protein
MYNPPLEVCLAIQIAISVAFRGLFVMTVEPKKSKPFKTKDGVFACLGFVHRVVGKILVSKNGFQPDTHPRG